MAPLSRFGRLGLTAIFIILLSLLNIATASSLPDDNINKTLVARNLRPISQGRYESYLHHHFPHTNRYIFYSGGAEDQVLAFIHHNPGYYYYSTLFNAPNEHHPWYRAFNEQHDIDDGEASSRAMAHIASGNVLVFGAIEYQTKGAHSFFTQQEIGLLHGGLHTGRIRSISHMIRGATHASHVMAYEDVHGRFTYQHGYRHGQSNASSAYGVCRRALGGCDRPRLYPKRSRYHHCYRRRGTAAHGTAAHGTAAHGTKGHGTAAHGAKGHGAAAQGAACPMRKPGTKQKGKHTTKGHGQHATKGHGQHAAKGHGTHAAKGHGTHAAKGHAQHTTKTKGKHNH